MEVKDNFLPLLVVTTNKKKKRSVDEKGNIVTRRIKKEKPVSAKI